MIITTTGQLATDNGVKVCTYGKAGAGKTKLCATAPRPFIFSNEGGTLSIAADNIPVAILKTAKDLDDAYLWAVTSAEARNYDTYCLDSISEMAETMLSTEKAKTKDPRAAYGEMQDKIATVIRLFRDFPRKNVYFTAKATIRKMPDGTECFTASMPGKTAGEGLPYFFDEFFYLGIAEYDDPAKPGERIKYRFLQTQPDIRFEAKDRSGALAPIEQPNLSYIFDKIRSSHTRTA